MATFQPPPTWALPILVDERTQRAIFNPIWLKWFVDLTSVLNAAGGTTPNIHNNLNSIQGGGATERYHLTSAQHTALTAGFVGTGNIVRATAPTVTTIQVSSVAGYKSSDGSSGYTGTVTTASLVGKTITIKDGIITGFA